MKNMILRVISLVAATAATSGQAQEYFPVAPIKAPSPLMGGLHLSPMSHAAVSLDGAAPPPPSPPPPEVDPLVCANPPAIAALTAGSFKNRTMTFTQASDAGLGVASLGTASTSKVLVQDWSRTAKCTANDGQTQLVYGQAIRLIASADDLQLDGDLTLPAIAAHATLNRKASKVEIEIVGFSSTDLNTMAAAIFGPLTVETFKDVDGVLQKLVIKAQALNGGTVQRIGMEFPLGAISNFAPGAFALQQISDGLSCNATKMKFGNATAAQASAIAGIYNQVGAQCDATAPDIVTRAKATQALQGIKVRK